MSLFAIFTNNNYFTKRTANSLMDFILERPHEELNLDTLVNVSGFSKHYLNSFLRELWVDQLKTSV